jgi:hypothetical protein
MYLSDRIPVQQKIKTILLKKKKIHIKENNRYSYGWDYGMVVNATVKYISNYISQFYW